ncbi:MAG: adenine methyltransferase [Desulfovibrio sp.]|uniref:DNA N-6-adenine-methyltransferase n=1 Tax=Desulfovibrio sp. TaxID=885 RepID=UPI00135ED487|nr:DNA N-6-adenine-methyltransferase [Desulfovibrio sp.]MTJ93864.1 adenine methyltransferase [Desulfovibrio sp.]
MGKGLGGHHSAAARSVVWLTPHFILDALGTFDLDPCAAPLPRPFPTAINHYTEADGDGLLRPWFGRIWLNPPYGKAMGRWMMRLAEHGRGSALIFARTETADFFRAIWQRADALLFLRGRLTFLGADGKPAKANGGAPSVLVAYGQEDVERLHDSGLDGRFVPLSAATCVFVAQAELMPIDGAESTKTTWRDLLEGILRREGRPLTLGELYEFVRDHPKGLNNRNVSAKIRQTLGRGGFSRVASAQYALAI